jgi:hypothetical protein
VYGVGVISYGLFVLENGTLDIAPDSAHPASPALPLPVAQLLAHTCGSLLYTLELSAFIEGQCKRLDYQDQRL